MGIFYRNNVGIPLYNRAAGEAVAPTLFPAIKSYLTESCHVEEIFAVEGVPIRGGAQRSLTFFR